MKIEEIKVGMIVCKICQKPFKRRRKDMVYCSESCAKKGHDIARIKRIKSKIAPIIENLPNEIWKNVEEYEGIYQVSNKGRVKNMGSLGNFGIAVKERLLRPGDNGHGYLWVNLCKDKVHKSKYVHRLVAEAFIPNPENKPCVNHIDRNKSNNSVDNLEWCTYKENNIHSIKTGNSTCKIVVDTKTGKVYRSAADAAKDKKINYHTLMCMLNGNDRNHTSLLYLSNSKKRKEFVVDIDSIKKDIHNIISETQNPEILRKITQCIKSMMEIEHEKVMYSSK